MAENHGVEAYRTWLIDRDNAPTTVRLRTEFAAARLAEWGAWKLEAGGIRRWLDVYHGWTHCTYHAHLTSLYRWLVDAGAVAASPMVDVPRRRPPAPRPRPLTAAELDAALEAAGDRMRAWLLLGSLAGLRAHEIAKLHGHDVTERTITVLGKGRQLAQVPTHPALWELAQRWPRDGYWFPSPRTGSAHVHRVTVSAAVSRHFRSVGIESGSIHRTRATYGTSLMRNGVHLRVIQDLLRHRSLQSTAHYLGVDDDQLSAAVRTLAA